MQRGLDGADAGREHFRDLFEAVVEELLEDDGGAFLRRQPLHQEGAGIAHGAGVLDRRAAAAPLLLGNGGRLAAAPPQLVDPQIGRDAQQIGARVGDRLKHVAERAEGAQQGVLRQVLRVPQVAGQPPAIAVQSRPQRRQQIDVAVPGGAQIVLQIIGQLQVSHVRSSVVFLSCP